MYLGHLYEEKLYSYEETVKSEGAQALYISAYEPSYHALPCYMSHAYQ